MGVLQRFERRLEEIVNRPFAKAFRAEVEPVEIAAALQRECDDKAAIVAKGRTLVPNAFTVELGPHDYERLATYEVPLTAELASMVREHADERQYSFVGPVAVRFELTDALDTGMLRVRSEGLASAPSGVRPAPTAAAGPQAWLEWSGTRVSLGTLAADVVIGRATDADVHVDDPGVSRHHARIRRVGGVDLVTDLSSTNGVLVDGHRVLEVALHDGDTFQVGRTVVTYHRDGAG